MTDTPTLQPVEQCDRDALLPCPFCGESGELLRLGGARSHRVGARCSDSLCGASNRLAFSEDEAIALWNTRLAAQSSPGREGPDHARHVQPPPSPIAKGEENIISGVELLIHRADILDRNADVDFAEARPWRANRFAAKSLRQAAYDIADRRLR